MMDVEWLAAAATAAANLAVVVAAWSRIVRWRALTDASITSLHRRCDTLRRDLNDQDARVRIRDLEVQVARLEARQNGARPDTGP